MPIDQLLNNMPPPVDIQNYNVNDPKIGFQEQMRYQKDIQAENMRQAFMQTAFQDQKHKNEEAAKAISDAVKDSHTLRSQMLQNIKSQ
jgi:hypothetical protein